MNTYFWRVGKLKVQDAYRQGKIPINSRVELKRGFSTRLSEKRYERLLNKAEDELRERPKEAQAWEMKGFALLRLERFDEALEAFGRVAKFFPERGRAWDLKTLAHYSLKYYQGAVRSFEDELSEPGVALLEEPFEKALAIDSMNAEAWNYRGVVLEKLGGYTKALKDFEKALEIDPNYRKARVNRETLFAWV